MNFDVEPVHRKFTFSFIGADAAVSVQAFTAREAISTCFSVEVSLVSEDPLVLSELMGNPAVLKLCGDFDVRYFHGVVNELRIAGRNGHFYLYEAHLVPTAWTLSQNMNFRIFQEQSVVEITHDLLGKLMPADSYEFRLVHEYEKGRYVVQYGESDWHFIARLLESEGIFYFFEHAADGHVLVVADDPTAYKHIQGDPCLACHNDAGLVSENAVVSVFKSAQRLAPGKVTLRNYNFKRPSLDMTTQMKTQEGEVEIYHYPGSYRIPEEGKRYAKIRLEERNTLSDFAEGHSNCKRFTAGFSFILKDHDQDALNTDYVLVEVVHRGGQNHVLGENSGIGGDSSYRNEFLAISATKPLRPERIIAKPTVAGIQSAVVVGPPGEEIYTDEYGRVKVQFHWDREGKKDEKSSCWLRIAQPWSGQSWGVIAIPRVGDEVLVAFINGDPDWPIVIGSVNNALSPALYPLPAKRCQSGIRTRSYPNGGRDNFHELRFDDSKGREEIYLQSERDWNIHVKHDKKEDVSHDETVSVGNDRAKRVNKNQTETIGVNKTIHVGVDHTESIGANMHLGVGASKNEHVTVNSSETVGAAKELTIGGLYQVTVGGEMNETVACAKTEEVGLAKAVFVGTTMTEKVAGGKTTTVGGDCSEAVSGRYSAKTNEYVIEASKITLKVGSSTIVIDESSITLKAKKIFKN
ncbi:type VI secretion system Vgr family protein [Geomesophilobacter sediminis]|uniref:Type VI secretion system tip protein VgrG n=1 Tax=Geomesophilobacter sediminis TaxID=2798584 RepID=A0A8J7JEK5_9BACT|nr:type VI secretion system tip protein TssI/VgrG [Geomesophilobacter sediminis]MBJ6724524.1 type VI secretion system tip protein VgrG [Geomesophilobacter sediminis]